MIIGTRSQSIKMVPVITGLKKYSERFEIRFYVTVQHREMVNQVLEAEKK